MRLVHAATLLVLAALAACGERSSDADRIAALEQRLDRMEQRMDDDRALMVRAFDASSQRLDAVLAKLEGSPTASAPTSRETTAEPAMVTPAAEPGRASLPPRAHPGAPVPAAPTGPFDLYPVLVIFLSVALVLMVAVVVFFPGRGRRALPQVDYSARVPMPDDEMTVVELTGEEDEAPPAPPPDHPLPEGQDPIRHELVLQVGDEALLRDLVDVLQSYLDTEPFILRQPAPRVALIDSDLHLSFFALPTLSQAEHALLDATVHRLIPRTGRRGGASGAA